MHQSPITLWLYFKPVRQKEKEFPPGEANGLTVADIPARRSDQATSLQTQNNRHFCLSHPERKWQQQWWECVCVCHSHYRALYGPYDGSGLPYGPVTEVWSVFAQVDCWQVLQLETAADCSLLNISDVIIHDRNLKMNMSEINPAMSFLSFSFAIWYRLSKWLTAQRKDLVSLKKKSCG